MVKNMKENYHDQTESERIVSYFKRKIPAYAQQKQYREIMVEIER